MQAHTFLSSWIFVVDGLESRAQALLPVGHNRLSLKPKTVKDLIQLFEGKLVRVLRFSCHIDVDRGKRLKNGQTIRV